MPAGPRSAHARPMALYVLQHHHQPAECPAAFAAWNGFDSPLREASAWSSCPTGGHHLWFLVEAADGDTALGQLPRYLAERTEAVRVTAVRMP
jgi:hypothetical protein